MHRLKCQYVRSLLNATTRLFQGRFPQSPVWLRASLVARIFGEGWKKGLPPSSRKTFLESPKCLVFSGLETPWFNVSEQMSGLL